MLRRIYCALLFLLVQNLLFSQSNEGTISSQFDEIVSSTMRDKEFVISAYAGGGRVYIMQRAKDSLFVTSYVADENNGISDVYSILVNTDELFPDIIDNKIFKRTVDSLYGDIKQNQSYVPYSKEVLNGGGGFYLTFYENNKQQVFCRKDALENQLAMVDFIINRVRLYSIVSMRGNNSRMKYLDIFSWSELLKYLSR